MPSIFCPCMIKIFFSSRDHVMVLNYDPQNFSHFCHQVVCPWHCLALWLLWTVENGGSSTSDTKAMQLLSHSLKVLALDEHGWCLRSLIFLRQSHWKSQVLALLSTSLGEFINSSRLSYHMRETSWWSREAFRWLQFQPASECNCRRDLKWSAPFLKSWTTRLWPQWLWC